MFTGIIEEVGMISVVRGSGSRSRTFTITAGRVLESMEIGDSVSVNGVCLTVVNLQKKAFSVEAVEETIKKTTLGNLISGDRVNLERAMKADGRFGGHIVQGHVDCVGNVLSIKRLKMSSIFEIQIPGEMNRYVVSTGSIAIDGVSLTVAEKLKNALRVSIIPHTIENTNFRYLKAGSRVNIEVDILAKYVESIIKQ
ncbi:MAG: riboflavin synthase [Candidatus Kryptoniota bacterium]